MSTARVALVNHEDLPAILNVTHDEAPYSIWSICSDGNAGLLRFRKTESMVHIGLRRFVRAWFDLWFSPRRLALRSNRGRLGSGSSTALVDRNGP